MNPVDPQIADSGTMGDPQALAPRTMGVSFKCLFRSSTQIKRSAPIPSASHSSLKDWCCFKPRVKSDLADLVVQGLSFQLLLDVGPLLCSPAVPSDGTRPGAL